MVFLISLHKVSLGQGRKLSFFLSDNLFCVDLQVHVFWTLKMKCIILHHSRLKYAREDINISDYWGLFL